MLPVKRGYGAALRRHALPPTAERDYPRLGQATRRPRVAPRSGDILPRLDSDFSPVVGLPR